ncbi:unnamed protein product [Mytilus edulis]|uniref:CUB domain-containing protein n=1 Tax=Mytilus edulis TaxID=6550 RepID=A0A8S3SED7_MYTED|nr:unnamed protein product [Mytilus edulis]
MNYGYLNVVTSLLIGLSTGRTVTLVCNVEDGGDLTLLGKFCGENIPPPLLALSGVVIIKFHSDKNVIRKGFLAVFNDSQDCVYVKKDGNGFIRSPNFPTTYPQEILCFYYIESVNKIPINITFTSFDLEHTSIGTYYQTTEELPSTLSFSTMSNTTFKPSLSSASDNTGRQRRTEKNQLGRKCSEKQPFDSSEHDHNSMENIDHDSTANSDGHRVAYDKSCFGTEIHVYANDTEMIKDVIVNDDVNNEYS